MSAGPAYYQGVFEVDAVARSIVERSRRPGADPAAVLAEVRAVVDHFYRVICDSLEPDADGNWLVREADRAGVRLALTPTHMLGPAGKMLSPR